MVEIEKLTGHGAPSVLLPGAKGQIYEDLDTGRLYECKGERGFIKIDGDDQCDEFNWVLKGVDISYNDLQDKPEQGGSTGGGGSVCMFYPDIESEVEKYYCTLTYAEVKERLHNGTLYVAPFPAFNFDYINFSYLPTEVELIEDAPVPGIYFKFRNFTSTANYRNIFYGDDGTIYIGNPNE